MEVREQDAGQGQNRSKAKRDQREQPHTGEEPHGAFTWKKAW